MKTADELKKAVGELKTKLSGLAAPEKKAEARAVRKRLKRAQRRVRQMTGRKLAAIRKKHGGEEAAKPAEGGEQKKA
jgi:hypothetical protein